MLTWRARLTPPALLAIALAALSLGLVLAARSIAGESAGNGFILSGLPPRSSAEYNALKKVAGNVKIEILEMTEKEMWSVPRYRIAAFTAAAKKAGATATRVNGRSARVLAPIHANQTKKMTPAQKSMMDKTMESKAVMGVTMMTLPAPDMMEHAFTRDMDLPRSGNPPPTLVIPLGDARTVTARRASVSKTADGYVWRGTIDGSRDAVTLMWWPDGRLAGTVIHGGQKFVLKDMGGGMTGVVEMDPGKMPAEHAPMGLEKMREMKLDKDPFIRQGDASMMLDGKETMTAAERRALAPKASEPRLVTITVLAAYTKTAASHYTDIERDLIAFAIEEANHSFRMSEIGHVRLALAHAYETGYVEKGGHFDHVFGFLYKDDGKADEVHALREQHHADVSVLIVDDSVGCGLAAKVAGPAERAFAVVHHGCAATMHSLAHEIGHIIGARHDSALDDSTEPFAYGHGFVNGTKWRTMMSYKESCGGCPRIPVWSNPGITIDGVPAGDATSHNARVISEQAARVAAFRVGPGDEAYALAVPVAKDGRAGERGRAADE